MKLDKDDMDALMSLEAEARANLGNKFNCAQSTFVPLAKRLGMDVDLALRLTTPFGGGMCGMGQTCGAVSGGLLAIGYTTGVSCADLTNKAECSALVKAFIERFRTLHGNILTCPGLLGLDCEDIEDLGKAKAENVSHNMCPTNIRDAARIVGELLGLEA